MRTGCAVALSMVLVSGALAQDPSLPDLDAITEMVESGRFAEAEGELRRVVSLYESPVARDLLGLVLSRQGRLEDAEREFLRAIVLDGEFLAAREHLGRLYLQQQRADEALAQLRAASRIGPLERELALWLAASELSRGNDVPAASQLRSVAERFDSVHARVQLAKIRAARGEHEEAMEILRRALEIAPNSEEVLSAYAKSSLAAQAPVAAIRTLEPLTRMHPMVAEYSYLLGVARLQIGVTDEAVEALERSLQLEPDRALTLIALGLSFNTQKRFQEAKEALTRGLEVEPENVEALTALAEAEEGLGELEEAERHVQRALTRVPSHPLGQLVLGTIRMKQARYSEARDALEQAVVADPSSAKAHYQLSLAYARLDDPESSQRHLELYRQSLRASEERLIALRMEAGVGVGGMKP